MYLRIFEGCNLHCDHCFIPSNPKMMKMGQFRDAANKIMEITKPGDTVLVQWHGGEPTAVPPRYFREAIGTLNSVLNDRVLVHGIQTNLINYTEEWRDIFREFFDSSIGVSWDYSIRKTKAGGKSNEDYEERFWANFERLKADGIQPYMVVTAAKSLFKGFSSPFDIINFLLSKGVEYVHFERITKTGYARENWDKVGLNNREYSDYMSSLYRAYLLMNINANTRDKIHISPFDGIRDSLVRLKNGGVGGYGCLSGACDTRFHTYDANGYKKGCTALTSEYDNKNANKESVVLFSDFAVARKIRQLDCRSCDFKKICSSGCLASDKFDESKECSGARGLFEAIRSFI
ncbi:radical SAM protein [Pseudomonas luteola]